MISLQSRFAEQRGFSILEVLASLTIGAIVMAIVISSVLSLRNTYFEDIKRTQINGNLRSAMDIISMNIRQAGENVLSGFPAVLLQNGASGASDTLILRRSPITEILTLCQDVSQGSVLQYVSSGLLLNAECIPSNVTPLYNTFTAELAAQEGNPRVFIYDSAQKKGEFLDYLHGGTSSGQYYLSTSGTSRAYNKLSTALYVIEEYQFSQNAATSRLELVINQETSQVRPVAFDITDFQVKFLMQDGSTLTSFDQQGSQDWKDIHYIDLTLSGRDTFKGRTFTSTINAAYFPRNVLSYEAG